jgi:hypothetical protein
MKWDGERVQIQVQGRSFLIDLEKLVPHKEQLFEHLKRILRSSFFFLSTGLEKFISFLGPRG